MKIIVCGAGQVGMNIARQLAAEGNEVTVIDNSPELIQRVGDTLDVRAILGYASRPAVLEDAGAEDADMIVAATLSDEVNMVACLVAHVLFNVPTRIARIRDQTYLQARYSTLFGRETLPIDVVISPELEVARALMRRLAVPGVFEIIPLSDKAVQVAGVRLPPACPIVNTPLRQLTALFPDLNVNVISISREGKVFVPRATDQMLVGDQVHFIVETGHLSRAMAAFGHEEPAAHRVVIVGGGNIGLWLAQTIERELPRVVARVVEYDPERANEVAQRLDRATVIQGDALDPETLEEANVSGSDTVIAVTDDDETNILVSLLAKRLGSRRTMALINKSFYSSLINPLDIDVLINPRAITVSTILQHVRRGRIRALHSLGDHFGEVIELEVLETSGVAGVKVREAKLPAGAIIGAIVRDGQVVIARGDTVIEEGDRVILFALEAAVKKVERLFSVKVEYF